MRRWSVALALTSGMVVSGMHRLVVPLSTVRAVVGAFGLLVTPTDQRSPSAKGYPSHISERFYVPDADAIFPAVILFWNHGPRPPAGYPGWFPVGKWSSRPDSTPDAIAIRLAPHRYHFLLERTEDRWAVVPLSRALVVTSP